MEKLCLCLLACSLLCTTAKAGVNVDVKWTRISTEYKPNNQVTRSQDTAGFLLDGHIVSFYSGSGKFKTSGNLGDTLEAINNIGVHYLVKYIYKNNLITQTSTFPGFIDKVRVKSFPDGTCNATITYYPLRGHKYIIDNIDNNKMYYEMHAENETCQLAHR